MGRKVSRINKIRKYTTYQFHDDIKKTNYTCINIITKEEAIDILQDLHRRGYSGDNYLTKRYTGRRCEHGCLLSYCEQDVQMTPNERCKIRIIYHDDGVCPNHSADSEEQYNVVMNV